MRFFIERTRPDFSEDGKSEAEPTSVVKCNPVEGNIWHKWSCEINSIEELKAIADKEGHDLVLSFNKSEIGEMDGIGEIYKSWRE